MKPLRIAFVHVQNPADPLTWSGIPSAILTHLVRAGCSVEAIGPLSRNIRCLLLPTWTYCKASHKFYHPDQVPLLTASFARQLERRMRGRHFDAILSTETFTISRLNRPEPITYWTDGLWDIMADYYYFNALSSFHAKAKLHEGQAMAKVAHAIYSSDWAADGARRHYGVDDRKLSVIPFGANLEIRHNRTDIEAAVNARRSDSCVLLFLGVDWARKGGEIAVETARVLNREGLKTQLLVVGCEVPGAKPEFVTEVGFVSKRTAEGQARLAQLLRTSNFLILPTRAECAGIVFSEASAFGLPIITTDTGGISTYVRQGGNGIRLPLSANAAVYADHIYRLFHDRAAYEAIALSGWDEYERRLNWDSSVSSLLSLLNH